ncbi:MAG: pirin family protein [Candidatus Yonathbacteria bacterium]|nr:pirin family protein [Candidatus Yonathbacteria bacterium]
MQKIIHREKERGGGEYGWLQTRYSFSFADWYEPTRLGFGRLRVINDDLIAPLGKFGMHPHRDFEIITIPLSGAVTHEDSLGNKGEVRTGEVQAMSAGTGVVHSEYNASKTEPLSLFQIWIEPNVQSAKPQYTQARFDPAVRKNSWQVLVSGDGVPGTLPVYQDARIARADMEVGTSLSYAIAHKGNGAYILVIEGEVEIEGEHLSKRDAMGISEADNFSISAITPASLLLIEVPVRLGKFNASK